MPLTTPGADPKAVELNQYLQALHPSPAMILFGAHARGDHRPGQTWIHVVIYDGLRRPQDRWALDEQSEAKAEELYGHTQRVWLHDYQPERWAEERRFWNSTASNAYHEGIFVPPPTEPTAGQDLLTPDLQERLRQTVAIAGPVEQLYDWTRFDDHLRHAEKLGRWLRKKPREARLPLNNSTEDQEARAGDAQLYPEAHAIIKNMMRGHAVRADAALGHWAAEMVSQALRARALAAGYHYDAHPMSNRGHSLPILTTAWEVDWDFPGITWPIPARIYDQYVEHEGGDLAERLTDQPYWERATMQLVKELLQAAKQDRAYHEPRGGPPKANYLYRTPQALAERSRYGEIPAFPAAFPGSRR